MTDTWAIPLDRPQEWSAALDGIPHAFAHTWGSCHAMHLSSGQPTYLYVSQTRNGRVVCPFAEREHDGVLDIVTPYGFSGIAGAVDADVPERWRGFMLQRRYVCGYIGLNPLVCDASYWPDGEIFDQSTLYILDLTIGAEALFRKLSSNRKRQIAKWKSAPGDLGVDDPDIRAFVVEHATNFLQSRGAATTYNFSRDTLSTLVKLETVFAVGIREQGQVTAASVFGYTPYSADYLFNVSVTGGEHYAAILLWSAVEILQNRGVPALNLGGGVREGDNIAEFKRRFGAEMHRFACLKQVYRAEEFESLCRRAGVDADDRAGYFPPYRLVRHVST